MGFNNIEKYSFFYEALRWYISKAFNIYYKVSVTDNSGIKKGDAVLFLPNHQNALIDPLAVLFTRKRQTAFLARSDMFRNKYIAKILYSFKILPVFRVRDGFSNLHKNKAIFDKTMTIIANGNGLIVFPEANHRGVRKLRALKKGAVRIAFQTELNYDNIDVKIVPVGIEYEHYYWFRSKLHVNYGAPIKVSEYIKEYSESTPIGINKINNAVKEGIAPLIINIPFEGEEYEAIYFLTEINNNNEKKEIPFADEVEAKKDLIKKIIAYKDEDSEKYEEWLTKIIDYKLLLSEIKTDDYSVKFKIDNKSHIYSYIYVAMLFPLYIMGVIFNYVPYKAPYIITSKIKDTQFHATMYLVLSSIISFPIFYGIYFYTLSLYTSSSYWVFIALAIIGVLGIFSHGYWKMLVSLKRSFRLRKHEAKDIYKKRNDISTLLQQLHH